MALAILVISIIQISTLLFLWMWEQPYTAISNRLQTTNKSEHYWQNDNNSNKSINHRISCIEWTRSISWTRSIIPPSGMNPPHVHPRASELLIVLQGVLEVGFVDAANKLFTQTLQAPDLFIFPKGLVHFQVNTKSDAPAYALGMFGSANAGTSSLPISVFGSGSSADILANAFRTDVDTISKLIEANKPATC